MIPMIRRAAQLHSDSASRSIAETRLNSFRTHRQERWHLLPIRNVGGRDEDLYLAYPVIEPGLHLTTPTPT